MRAESTSSFEKGESERREGALECMRRPALRSPLSDPFSVGVWVLGLGAPFRLLPLFVLILLSSLRTLFVSVFVSRWSFGLLSLT